MAYTPLSHSQFKEYRLRKGTYSFLHGRPVVPVFVSEAPRAALDLPLAFAPAKKGVVPVAVLSLNQEDNAQVGPQGEWMGGYMPAQIRCHPFSLAFSGERATLLVDRDSEWLSTEEGEPLFDDQGNVTELVQGYIETLKQTASSPRLETEAVAAITNSDILQPWIQEPVKLFRISEPALNGLSEHTFLRLHQQGALPLVYAHLISLARLERIRQLARQKEEASRQWEAEAQTKPRPAVMDFEQDMVRFST